ncbi:BZ3500_MvSof-1268-A1-R1_Chr1-3g01556 [Microbotryum saponariae]|uniref:RNA helicase n=1 Tax=Microbotryum saponariae TaxID=289078 RepID=A0A2X0L2G1_9BASI|nr:BZ3500_MvSof-1268-A1-R1_Chr1-3g01556 [Microbotryum saponariae]SCZ94022.1 BZ3501_MvSof-1269-A2-R1_Chr1-3g01158 [Microbotryum saponariae]
MSDFVYTLDSDDELNPQEGPAKLGPIIASAPIPATRPKVAKRLREETKVARARGGPTLLSKKAGLVTTTRDQPSTQGDDESTAGESGAMGDEGAQINSSFVFDGLGGGYVGTSRNSVWDAGDPYLVRRPNAIPRVTVDEIIARRAPTRKVVNSSRADNASSQDVASSGFGSRDEGGLPSAYAPGKRSHVDADAKDRNWLEQCVDEVHEGHASTSSGKRAYRGLQTSSTQDEGSADRLPVSPSSIAEGSDRSVNSDGSDYSDDDSTEDNSEGRSAPHTGGFAALAEIDPDLLVDEEGFGTSVGSDSPKADSSNEPDGAAAIKAFFAPHTVTSSSSTNLSFATLPGCTISRQLLLALSSLSLAVPTPIQRECIPIAMMGKDIVASSATGSGKTVAFWIGVLERLLHRDRRNSMTRVVVITPTRELAVQVHGVGKALARYTDVEFCLCVGGLSLKVQEAELKQRPDIVVSTPGRLIDHVRNTPSFTMDGVEILVLDEADRMLEEGFRSELEEIIEATPRSRQTLLFSATVTESIAQLTRLSMNKPVRVKVDQMGATAPGLVQEFLRVRGDRPGEAIERGFRSGERTREALLVTLCARSFATGRTIIFFRSKAQAHRMKIIFSLVGQGLQKADELHGDLTQEQRLESLKRFREGECSFLLATDLASRGLDIKGIDNVINYEMPRSIEIYLHRVGRTARAGRQGRALTLVGESDRKLVKLAVKHAPPESIQQRVIPVEAHFDVLAQLQELESEVKAVQREEREETETRKGEMELSKGRNLIQHEREIHSRPARTWFQTTQEKNIAKTAGLNEHNQKFRDRKPIKPTTVTDDRPAPKRTAFSGLSRKEKRRKLASLEDAEDDDRGKIEGSIRSAKRAALPRKMTVASEARATTHQSRKSKERRAGDFDRELGVSRRAIGELDDESGSRKSSSVRGGVFNASRKGNTRRQKR